MSISSVFSIGTKSALISGQITIDLIDAHRGYANAIQMSMIY